jgi:hypothetical protein
LQRRILVFVAGSLAAAVGSGGQELVLGSVRIRPGASEQAVVADLRRSFRVDDLGGGWQVRPRDATDSRTPWVAFHTQDGRVTDVGMVWSTKAPPSPQEVLEQLSHALPSGRPCLLETQRESVPNGSFCTLVFRCGRSRIRWKAGSQGENQTTSISVEFE